MKTNGKALLNSVISIMLAIIMVFTMAPLQLLGAKAVETSETVSENESDPNGSEEVTPIDFTFRVTGEDGPLQGAKVRVGDKEARTGSTGVAIITLAPGTYDAEISKNAYSTQTVQIAVSIEHTSFNVNLTKKDVKVFTFSVVNSGLYSDDVRVAFDGVELPVYDGYNALDQFVSEGDSQISQEQSLGNTTQLTYAVKLFADDTASHTIEVVPSGEAAKLFDSLTKTVTLQDSGAKIELPTATFEVEITNAGGESKKKDYKYGDMLTVTYDRYRIPGFDLVAIIVNGQQTAVTDTDTAYECTVTEDLQISFVYATTVTVEYDKELGSVTVTENGRTAAPVKTESNTYYYTLNKGSALTYTVSAKSGYQVKSVTVNGNNTGETGTVQNAAAIKVEFEEKTYNLTVQLLNSPAKLGSGTVQFAQALNKQKDTVSIAANKNIGSMTESFEFGYSAYKENNGSPKYDLDVVIKAIEDGYKFVRIDPATNEPFADSEGNPIKYTKDDKISFSVNPGDAKIILKLERDEYELTFIDPFAAEQEKKITVNEEEGTYQLPSASATPKGYTFQGWSADVPNGIKTGITEIEMPLTEDQTYYAVYTINPVTVTGSGAVPCLQAQNAAEADTLLTAEYYASSNNDGFADVWFANNVTLTITGTLNEAGKNGSSPLSDAVITVSVNDEPVNALSDNGTTMPQYALIAAEGDTQVVSITQTVTKEYNDETITYVSDTADVFTVRFDVSAPELKMAKPSVSDDGDTFTEEFTVSDTGSGVRSVQYAMIDISDPDHNRYHQLLAPEKNLNQDTINDAYDTYLREIRSMLREENWIDFELTENNKYSYQYTYTENVFIVYRVVDKAGNDVYSAFDRTRPKIDSVKWTYSDELKSTTASTGNIYATGDITVNMDLADKFLAFTNAGYKYDGAKLHIVDKSNKTEYVVDMTGSDEKFSIFYDKWQCSFVISADFLKNNGLADKPLSFYITAQDQATNSTLWTYPANNELVLVTKAPEISVEYKYTDKNGEQTCTDLSSIVSGNPITAIITVTDPFFGNKDKPTAAPTSVTAALGNTEKTIKWTKQTQSEWVGYVEITQANGEALNVIATSQVGKECEYTSGALYIDKVLPVITTTVSYADRDPASAITALGSVSLRTNTVTDPTSAIYNNGVLNKIAVTVTAADAHIGSFGAEDAIVKVNGKTVDVEWKEVKKGDGSVDPYKKACAFELSQDEGAYEVEVFVRDQAGNENTKDLPVLYNDNTPMTVESITMTVDDGNFAAKVLRLISFGMLYTAEIHVDVKVSDVNMDIQTEKDAKSASGPNAVVMFYDEYEPDSDVAPARVQIEQTEHTADGVFTFTLPAVKGVDAEKVAYYYSRNLSFLTCDNVGNMTAITDWDTFGTNLSGEEIVNFKDEVVLYENKAPQITSSLDNKDGKPDTGVLYFDDIAKPSSYWVRKGAAFEIVVDDTVATESVSSLISGLYSIDVLINGNTELTKYNYSVLADKTLTERYAIHIAYDDLKAGQNEIKVYVVDNAGNESSASYTVYKDDAAPIFSGLNIDAGKGSNLSYGNFYSEDVELTVTVTDPVMSSGIDSIEVIYYENDTSHVLEEKDGPKNGAVEAYSSTTRDAGVTRKFNLKAFPDTTGTLTVILTDNVGNRYVYDGGEDGTLPEDTNLKSQEIFFDQTAPEITETVSTPDYTCKEEIKDSETDKKTVCEKRWYKTTDIAYTIDVADLGVITSGIRSVVTTLNGVRVKDASAVESAEKNDTRTYSFNFNDIKNADETLVAHEGENTVIVTVTDNSGLVTTQTYYIYIDLTAPVVENFSFKGRNGNEETAENAPNVQVTDYGYYFSKKTTVTVYVADAIPSSGLATVYFAAVPVDSAEGTRTGSSNAAATYCVLKADGTEKNSSSAEFTVEAGFKGQIYAYVVDNVGNISVDDPSAPENWTRPDGLIIETQEQHNSREQHVRIDVSRTNYVTDLANGTPLFGGDATVTLYVSDEYAGIKSIEATVVSTYDQGKNASYPVTFNNAGSAARGTTALPYAEGNVVSGWTVTKTDINLVTKAQRTITVTNNSNDITVYLKMTDNSGNISDTKYVLNIDKDAPVISVSMVPSFEGDDATYTGYFKEDRTLTVKIIERNFDLSRVIMTVTRDGGSYPIPATFSNGVLVSTDVYGIENYEYTLVYVFHEDGDYTFAIEATDKAMHRTEDAAVNYGSPAEKEVAKVFTIDQTAPVIGIDISGNKGKDIYYDGHVTLTIAVNEHNYADERYLVTIDMKDSQSGQPVSAPVPVPTYTVTGDVHTYVYVFTEEFMSQLTAISVTDKAGNLTEGYSGSYAGENFVVDLTNPEVEIFKQDRTTKLNETASAEEEFAPVITFYDVNLDANDSTSYEVTLTGNYNGNNLAQTETYRFTPIPDSTDPGRLTLVFDAFPKEETVDDIYTINVTITDKAGKSSSARAVFSVNRFGSTFMVSESTKKLTDRFYTKEPEEIVIIQINSAPIDSQRVAVNHDNIASNLVEDKDYKVSVKNPLSGDDTATGWYEYTYTIYASNFTEEGVYSVIVYSTDMAQNNLVSATSRRSINLFETKHPEKAALVKDSGLEAPVNFLVDKTPPIISTVGLEKPQYYTRTHEFSISASDNKSLKEVDLYVDGEKVRTFTAEEIESGTAVYELSNSTNNKQQIRIVATDSAGNTYDSGESGVQVTRNLFRYIMGNTAAKVTIVSVLAVGAVFLIILIKRKKSKKEEA